MDLSKYRQLYVSETQENLDELARRLVQLESAPDDREHIDTVFRLFHSIKGMSGTMGYTPLFELAHQLEELMDGVRKRERLMDPAMADVLLAGVDRMVRWVADVEAERALEGDEALHGQIRTLLAIPSSAPADPSPADDGTLRPEDGDLVIALSAAETCPDPGMRGFVLHRKLAGVGEVRGVQPPLDVLRSGQPIERLQMVLRCAHAPEKIERFIRLAPEWAEVSVTVYEAPAAAVGSDDLSLDGFDDDDDDLDALLDLGLPAAEPPAPAAAEPATAEPPTAEPHATEPHAAKPPAAPALAPAPVTRAPDDDDDAATLPEAAAIVRPRPARTIRVRTDWLDTLLDRVGDLIIVSQRMWAVDREQPRPQMTRLLGELSRLLGGLHGEALSVRMTPLSVLTDRLPRVVRDLCRQVDKRASLVVHGDDQRVDRAIIEGLDAPLAHLLRNAVEHGIEPPDMRQERGKSASGLLVLECRRVRDEIVVELRDDGKGIDARHLARRAARMGLLDAERAQALAERDLSRLICLPGLSSREKAGRMSGRGVGMDAVHEAVSALGGRVAVTSVVGEGTTITLHLPRTPGISRLLLVEHDGQTYGLPLNQVQRTGVFEPTAGRHEGSKSAPGGTRTARETASLPDPDLEPHTDELPLWSLAALLGADDHDGGRRPGVVIEAGRRVGVVLVDRIVGQIDALLKPLGPLLERIAGLSGVTLDSEGRAVFVLDVPRLVEGLEDDGPPSA